MVLAPLAAAATSRLLFQYPDPQLRDILDFLFLPSHGVALHHLKVEIGGDGQSSEGVEPSHAHFAGDANFSRGYEWRLMREARARNPSILLSALAWTWPGWVGAGTDSPWADPPRAAGYIVAWLQGARTQGIELQYVDADWNERGFSVPFVLALRAALDGAGFAGVAIVCGDDARRFGCAAAAAANATLRAAIAALGAHGPAAPDPIAVATGLPLWGSEVHVTDPGGADLAPVFQGLYATFNITGFLLWNALSAYNPALFSPDWGIFRAWWPWCGHYELDGKAWVFAHFTQATAPGWAFVAHGGGGAGALRGGGQWSALAHAPSGGFTLIISKPLGAAEEVATFALAGAATLPPQLFAVRSLVAPGGDFGRNLSGYFVAQAPVPITGGGLLSLRVAPGELWTLTTVGAMRKGAPASAVPATAPFPGAYADSFDACAPPQEAPYFTDMTGAFECTPDDGGPPPRRGVVMRQVVPQKPLAWRPDEQRPFTVFAADAAWAAEDVSVDVRVRAANDTALLGVRANPNGCCGRVIAGEDLMPGAWLALRGARWWLWNAIANVSGAEGLLAQGAIGGAPITPGEWRTARLAVSRAGALSAWLDGAALVEALPVQGAVPDAGFVGFGTGSWGQFVDFDAFRVTGSSK
jgi:galactosylceramidase